MSEGHYTPDASQVAHLRTLAPDCDEQQARFLLEAAHGDMELAFTMYLGKCHQGFFSERTLPDGASAQIDTEHLASACLLLSESSAEHAESHAPPAGPPPPPAPRGAAPTPPRPRAPAAWSGPQQPAQQRRQGRGLVGTAVRIPVAALRFGFGLISWSVWTGLHVAAVVGDRVLPRPLMRALRGASYAIPAPHRGHAPLPPAARGACCRP